MAPSNEGQCLFGGERKDFAWTFRMKLGTGDNGEEDEEGFKRDCTDDPTDHRFARIAFRFGGEELLIHALVADEQQRGRQHQAEAPANHSRRGPENEWQEDLL